VPSAPCARGPSGPPMDGFFFFTQTRPTAPGSLTAHRFTPPGTLRGPGRSRAARSRPVWLGPTRIPARPTRLRPTQTRSRCHPCPAQADSDHRQSTRLRPTRTQRPAASHDAGHSGFTGPGLPSRVLARHTPTGPIVQSPKVDQYAGEEYVAATTTSSSWTPSKDGQYQGVSRIQRRPLFGTQCRPVGGPAGFEPHRHRTASCPATRACA